MNQIKKGVLVNAFEDTLRIRSSIVDSQNTILFQVKDVGRNIQETTLARHKKKLRALVLRN